MSEEAKEYLLKECYDLAERFETQEPARAVLREKSKKVSDGTMMFRTVSTDKSDMQKITETLLQLTIPKSKSSIETEGNLENTIEVLPECAEKFYLRALMILRNGTNETQRTKALRELENALIREPEDPRFITLANILNSV